MLKNDFIEDIGTLYDACMETIVKDTRWKSAKDVRQKLAVVENLRNEDKLWRDIDRGKTVGQGGEFREDISFVKESGMNTPGLLMDRLSILYCKKHLSAKSCIKTTNLQIADISKALYKSGYSEYVLLEKEQVQQVKNPKEQGIRNLCHDIHYANICMWINQDLLYTDDPNKASHERLKDYLIFFSVSNSLRNRSIGELDRIAFRHAKLAKSEKS